MIGCKQPSSSPMMARCSVLAWRDVTAFECAAAAASADSRAVFRPSVSHEAGRSAACKDLRPAEPRFVLCSSKSESISTSDENEASKRSPVKPGKKWTWKKPKGKPKRPLSAYNIFFRRERERMLEEEELAMAIDCAEGDGVVGLNEQASTNGHVGDATSAVSRGGRGRELPSRGKKARFYDLAKHIAERWRDLDEPSRSAYEGLALEDKRRYIEQLRRWEMEQAALGIGTKKKIKNARRSPTRAHGVGRINPLPSRNASSTANSPSGGALSEYAKTLNPSAVNRGSARFDTVTSEMVQNNFAKLTRLYGGGTDVNTDLGSNARSNWPLVLTEPFRFTGATPSRPVMARARRNIRQGQEWQQEPPDHREPPVQARISLPPDELELFTSAFAAWPETTRGTVATGSVLENMDAESDDHHEDSSSLSLCLDDATIDVLLNSASSLEEDYHG